MAADKFADSSCSLFLISLLFLFALLPLLLLLLLSLLLLLLPLLFVDCSARSNRAKQRAV